MGSNTPQIQRRLDEAVGVRTWGRTRALRTWARWLIAGPLLTVLGGSLGLVVAAITCVVLLIFFRDPRLVVDEGLWMALVTVLGMSGGVFSAWRFGLRTRPRRLLVTEQTVAVSSAFGRTTMRWDRIVRAFVTTGSGKWSLAAGHPAPETMCLHLWTPWREVALPLSQLFTPGHFKPDQCVELLTEVEAHLNRNGKHLERDVPCSEITNPQTPIRYTLFWPHRRWLARSMQRVVSGPAVDHRTRVPSMSLAWVFRPAPMMVLSSVSVATVIVRWGTEASWVPMAFAVGGLLFAFALPLWNLCKDRWVGLLPSGKLRPEQLIGNATLPHELPDRLIPARGCEVDLTGTVRRPDGRRFDFSEITEVIYGPQARSQASGDVRTIAVRPWQLTVRTADNAEHEIYHNASADMIRYGDLEGGFAAFNWVLAREIAKRSGAGLQLAHGKVSTELVGEPLTRRLAQDVVHYDPEAALQAFGECKPSIQVEADADHFSAWGPLTRFPEGCATPPLYRLAFAGLSLAMMPLFPPAGMIAGYMVASAGHDLIMHQHFSRPGFRMDHDGVWVRGECIAWEQLEQATLLPVSPGPIFFAGRRSVLISGYLAATYRDRAWLGCSAWRWIQDHICEEQ